MSNTKKIGVTIGDPNGIGPEIILKNFKDKRLLEEVTPIVFSTKNILNQYVELFDYPISIHEINSLTQCKEGHVNAFTIPKDYQIQPGTCCEKAGEISFVSLKIASSQMMNGQLDALVTAPINKSNIQNDEFQFRGHTEYFTSLSNTDLSLMLMIYQNLRVALVTNHLPLAAISSSLTKELICKKGELLNQTLIKDFGIIKPKIAVLGLNPHSGDKGLIGNEEEEIINPSIRELKKNGVLAFGPFPTDGFFANNGYSRFDAVLAMYHDQGLTPFKILSQNHGVNFTAGLPIVRTSPDHGTAYDIAGKGVADETSFRNAIYSAIDISRKRIK
ncbi:MAG: 4-hydroxythreonine-4-phosphate dehydrogenase PdxA [Bacteroidota bacterium]|nr:4-hydroxythreonine-4-phosphate dehydrogenase PdxA [Bacteroidota bacterium]